MIKSPAQASKTATIKNAISIPKFLKRKPAKGGPSMANAQAPPIIIPDANPVFSGSSRWASEMLTGTIDANPIPVNTNKTGQSQIGSAKGMAITTGANKMGITGRRL